MTDQPYTNDDPAPHATSGRLTGSAAASSRESDEEEFHIGVGRPYPHLTTRAVEPSLERGTLITGGSTPRPATAGTRDPGTSGDAADVTTPSDASPLADDSAASSEPATGGGPESEAGEEAEEALADTTVPPYWAQRAASRSDDGTARRPGQPGGLGSTSTTQAQRGGGAGARSAPSSASRARVSGAATPAAGQAATARMTAR